MSQAEAQLLEKVTRQLPESLAKMELSQEERGLLQKLMREQRPDTPEEKQAIVVREFKLVGVLRTPDHKDDNLEEMFESFNTGSEIHLPTRTAEDFFFQLPRRAERGFSQVRVVVDSQENLQGVVGDLKEIGLQTFSMGIFVQQVRHNVMLIGFALDFVALVALVVAALGIANTMFTSVLERTREIGILKAVGARDRQVLLIFLAEGALIGLLGGALGVLIGWLLSFPGDHRGAGNHARARDAAIADDGIPLSTLAAPGGAGLCRGHDNVGCISACAKRIAYRTCDSSPPRLMLGYGLRRFDAAFGAPAMVVNRRSESPRQKEVGYDEMTVVYVVLVEPGSWACASRTQMTLTTE